MNKQSQPIIDLHDLKKLLQVCLANWYIIVGFLLAFTIAGYWYVFAKENYPCARVVLSTKFNSFAKKESSQDKEVEIDAYKLIENTIDRTQMDVSYYKLPNGTASTHDLLEEYRVAVDSIPFKTHLSITHKQLYDKNIRLKIIDDSRFEISYPWQATQITKQGYFDSVLNTPHLQLQATHYAYNKLLSPITPLYVLQIHNKEDVITAIQNRLDIKTQKETAQLLLEYSDWLPSNALSFLESFSQTYTQECLKQQQENNDKLLAGMDALLKKTEAALRDIQQDIWNNKTTTITNNKEEQAFFPLADVMVEKKRIEQQYANLVNLEKHLLTHTNSGVPPPYLDETTDVFIQNSLAEMYNIDLTKKDNLFSVTDQSVSLIKEDYTFENRKKNLLEYLKNAQEALRSKIEIVEGQMSRSLSSEYHNNQLYTLELERRLKANEAIYINLLERKNNILIAKASLGQESLIVESPHIISKNDAGKSLQTFASFLVIGLMAAGMCIYCKNILYKRIESLEDLKEVGGNIPILGELPYIHTPKKQFMIQAHADPLGASLLRIIRTNLDQFLLKNKFKIILITSHTPNEGKTFAAVNIGAILALANKKVLLLDMDLHKPNVHQALGMNNHHTGQNKRHLGMPEIFKKECSIKEAVIKTSQHNMDAITAQASLKNAPEMLLGEVTKTIMDYGGQHYDYVIIDTPPVGLTPDALTLMKYSSLNIYVINSTFPYKNSLNQATEIKEEGKVKMAFLLNKVKNKKLKYYSKEYNDYSYAYALAMNDFAVSE